MIKFFINLLKTKTMAKPKMKTCTISGRKFKNNNDNFYVNRNSRDGLHPYHKDFDNFRRSTNASVAQIRKIVNLING
jgi:hypothetical protein